MSEIAKCAPEWHSALTAADTALTALRAATAHRDAIPTITNRPDATSPIHSIRAWVLDVRRIIARTIPLVIPAAGNQDLPTILAAHLTDAADSIATLHDMNRGSGQRGSKSWALPTTATQLVPVWTSRRAWLAQVEHAVTTGTGPEICRARETSPTVVLQHAVIYANHADGITGRGVTASRATIITETKMSDTADKRARRVLRDLALLADGAIGRTLTTAEYLAATLHHGASQSRAASTLHLTTPPHLAHIVPIATKQRDPLSPTGISRREVPVKNYSPNARERASRQNEITKKRREARPMHLQRAAANLLNRIPALRHTVHMGSICQVITSAGIDTTIWTGQDIANALNTDSQRRGWMWPSTIADPCGLIAWRLRRIDWTGLSPTATAKRNAESLQVARKTADLARRQAYALRASDATRKRRMAEIKAHLASAAAPVVATSDKTVADSRQRPATTPNNSARTNVSTESTRTMARAEIASLRKSFATISFPRSKPEGN